MKLSNNKNYFESSFLANLRNKNISYISKKDEDIVASIYSAINEKRVIIRPTNNPPDFCIITEDVVWGIEHFMINESDSNSKGSKLLQNEQFRQMDFSTGECLINEDISIDYLIRNFLKSFNKHAERVEKYKDNLSNQFPNKSIKVIFAIDHYNPFRLQTIAEKSEYAIDIFHFRRVVNTIHKNEKIDGILYSDGINIVYFTNNHLSYDYFYERGFYLSGNVKSIKGVRVKPIKVNIDGSSGKNEIEYPNEIIYD